MWPCSPFTIYVTELDSLWVNTLYFQMNMNYVLENMVLQIREHRINGSPDSMLQVLLNELSYVFETEILHVMYEWLPGTSLHNIDNLANFILKIRDVHGDYGERDVSYMLLWIWYTYFPEWALRIFRSFVGEGIGCWSDVKYMCKMLRNLGKSNEWVRQQTNKFQNQILDVMLQQLLIDNKRWEEVMEGYFENRCQYFGIGEKYEGENNNGGWKRKRDPLMSRPLKHQYVSFASKWCPREKSKFGWLFVLLVRRYTYYILKKNKMYSGPKFSENARKFRQMLMKIHIPVESYSNIYDQTSPMSEGHLRS